jgi:hypothetical protein
MITANLFNAIYPNTKIYIEGEHDIFNSSHIKQLSEFKFFVDNSNSRERIPSFENDFSWFGLMGATYNFLANNFENMAILFLIVPKVLLAKLVQFALRKCIGRTIFSLESYPEILFSELIGMCPLMVVSAYESLLNCGYEYTNERINIVLHIVLLQMMIMCPFVLFIYEFRKLSR